MKERIRHIFRQIREEVDGIVIANSTKPHVDMTFYYATGLIHGEYEGSAVLLYPDGNGEILTSSLEEESARRSGLPVSVYSTGKEREDLLKEKLGGMDRVGINPPELTYRAYGMIKKFAKGELVDVSEGIATARNFKDGEEINRLREACRIASSVADEMPGLIRAGMKEFQVAAEVSYAMKKMGASGDAFEIISSSGPNTAEPHYTSGDRKVGPGDFVLLDFGAYYKRYCSDITRTFVVGEASEKQERMYHTVLKAQEAALEVIEPGVKGKAVHEAAAAVIDDTEFKGRFIHGLGHSIGLSVHDGTGLSPNVDIELEPGMVFTVEPGVYLPGYGGVRIEDNIVVTKGGYELLTDARKDRLEVID